MLRFPAEVLEKPLSDAGFTQGAGVFHPLERADNGGLTTTGYSDGQTQDIQPGGPASDQTAGRACRPPGLEDPDPEPGRAEGSRGPPVYSGLCIVFGGLGKTALRELMSSYRRWPDEVAFPCCATEPSQSRRGGRGRCSLARSTLAALSSTPLMNLCPCSAPKALASSTASLITTRYGTSMRYSSS
jgi:hypothetical protein